MKLTLLTAFGFCAFNMGLIWIVQVVHYPGFLRIGSEGYQAYQQFHMRSITTVVGPSMLAELLSSAMLLLFIREINQPYLVWISLLLLVLIWINTALWAVPSHNKLLDGYDANLITKLIQINWWRTVAWTLRTILLGYVLLRQWS